MKRALVIASILLVLTVVLGALSAGVACAHDPRFACSPRDERPIAITDPQKSWAFYGRLANGRQDRYTIETARAVAVPVQLLVDRRDAQNPARPFASIADSAGRVFATIDLAPEQSFFEPFSRVTYVASAQRLVKFPAGSSTIAITTHGGEAPQRYTLAIGSEERFGVWEMPYLLGAVFRIHQQKF